MSYLKELKNVDLKPKAQWFNEKLISGLLIALIFINFVLLLIMI